MTTVPLDGQQLPLPGLTPPAVNRGRPESALEIAVRRTIAALDDEGLVSESDAATLQLMLECAEIIVSMKGRNRTSTVDKPMRLLWELKESIKPSLDDEVEESDVDRRLDAAMAAWAQVLEPEKITGGQDGA